MTSIQTKRVRGGPRMTAQVTDVDASDNLRTIIGRAVPFDTWALRGWFQLSFARTCFDKSIKESAKALPLLLFHDYESFPVGRATKWESRADGLWGEWALDDAPEAQRAARLAREGVLTGLSIGWQPLLQEWQVTDLEEWNADDADTLDRCTVKEARLIECSLTPTPNFADAYVTQVAHRDRPVRSSLAEWKRWRASLTP